MTWKPRRARILLWDIESTSLNADFGVILCIGYRWAKEKKVHIIRIDKGSNYKKCHWDDSYVVKEFLKVLSGADVQVTWYGKRFDWPMLQSRMLFHNLGRLSPPPVPHIDLWETARKQLKLSSNRLKNVQAFLGLPEEKTPVSGRTWLKAAMGDSKALRYIVGHCRKDIVVLEQAYERLLPIIRMNRPNLRLIQAEHHPLCPACGEDALIRNGYYMTLCTRRLRYRCTQCGSSCSAPVTRPKDTR